MQDHERGTSDADLELLKPEEAARYLRVSPYWLLKQAREGVIPHRRYGTRIIRFARDDLDEIKDMGGQPVAGRRRRTPRNGKRAS